MDELGARVGCPRGEEVIVPSFVKELYTPSPKIRKSVTSIDTISADGREPPPPLVICLGKRVIESWIHDNLKGSEVIALSTIGYTNEQIAIYWLKHFIKHVEAGPNKPIEDNIAIDPQLLEDDIALQLERVEEAILAIDDSEDSDKGDNIPSDDDDSIASFDSIARNADFISLGH
jgi:hypothetical protein